MTPLEKKQKISRAWQAVLALVESGNEVNHWIENSDLLDQAFNLVNDFEERCKGLDINTTEANARLPAVKDG